MSKRAPSTTRTSLRFRINDLRAVEVDYLRDCDTSPNLSRSPTAILLRRIEHCFTRDLCAAQRQLDTRCPRAVSLRQRRAKPAEERIGAKSLAAVAALRCANRGPSTSVPSLVPGAALRGIASSVGRAAQSLSRAS